MDRHTFETLVNREIRQAVDELLPQYALAGRVSRRQLQRRRHRSLHAPYQAEDRGWPRRPSRLDASRAGASEPAHVPAARGALPRPAQRLCASTRGRAILNDAPASSSLTTRMIVTPVSRSPARTPLTPPRAAPAAAAPSPGCCGSERVPVPASPPCRSARPPPRTFLSGKRSLQAVAMHRDDSVEPPGSGDRSPPPAATGPAGGAEALSGSPGRR